jgi:hypothetical protein
MLKLGFEVRGLVGSLNDAKSLIAYRRAYNQQKEV